MSIVICEFSLFMNIKHLHNIGDNIFHSSILNLFLSHGEAYRQSFVDFQTIFNQNMVDWSLVYGLLFHKCSWKSVQYFLRYLNIHKQAEFMKNNGHVSSIVYRIERSLTKGHATLIYV